MSKARANARAERAQLAQLRAAAAQAERERTAQERARSERRRMAWRRLRLWQHGPGFARHREQWGVLAVIAFLVLLVVYLVTRSFEDLFGTALALAICAPVMIVLFVDRSRK